MCPVYAKGREAEKVTVTFGRLNAFQKILVDLCCVPEIRQLLTQQINVYEFDMFGFRQCGSEASGERHHRQNCRKRQLDLRP